jgi:hypothetical protein
LRLERKLLIQSLLRTLAALIAALCGLGLISFAVIVPFSFEGFDVDPSAWGLVLVFFGVLVFLFASGVFLLYLAVNYFRHIRS